MKSYHRFLFRPSVYLLLLAVVFMLSTTMSHGVAHDLQHATHHTSTSHSAGPCAWMCAAGGMAQQGEPSLGYAWYQADSVSPFSPPDLSTVLPITLSSRAPPSIG